MALPRRASQTALEGVGECLAQLGERPSLAWGGAERAVERAGEGAGKVAPVALEGLERPTDAPRGGGGGRSAHGVDASQRLVEDERE